MELEMDSQTTIKAAAPSLVEKFEIIGLHGYRDLSMLSPHAATVLIAPNGAGKTTLLATMYAFLTIKFNRLRDLNFKKIVCKLRGYDALELTYEDVQDFLLPHIESEVARYARKIGVEINELVDFLVGEYSDFSSFSSSNFRYAYGQDKIFDLILKHQDHNYQKTMSLCFKLHTSLYAQKVNTAKIIEVIKLALKEINVVYLPTYRRVELALDSREDGHNPWRRRSKKSYGNNSLFKGNIQFGLSDIADRLNEISHTINLESSIGYRKITADIITELLAGIDLQAATDKAKIPSEEELRLFFQRLKSEDIMPFARADISPPNMDMFYEKLSNRPDSGDTTNEFLRYFLAKLSTVIEPTKETERRIDDFVARCNLYLSSSQEPTWQVDDIDNSAAPLSKYLSLDRQTLALNVVSVSDKRYIPLDLLSSGEKQMISLLGSLFLYPEKKIVLIDEPELSLALDWQKKILVDILAAPLCSQLIAITHSPFVFENELEPFAKLLQSFVNLQAADDLFSGENDVFK